jgi:LPXTG-motif cell wall-anchored protein
MSPKVELVQMPRRKAAILAVIAATLAYALTYLICFVCAGVSWELLFDYLKWSWIGGGEIPTIIQGISFLAGMLAAIAAWFLFRKRKETCG